MGLPRRILDMIAGALNVSACAFNSVAGSKREGAKQRGKGDERRRTFAGHE